MKYTVIGYVVPSGRSHTGTYEAENATEAVKAAIHNLSLDYAAGLAPEDFEVIGVIKGEVVWDSSLDLKQIYLFP